MRGGTALVSVLIVTASLFPVITMQGGNTDGPTFPLEVITDKYYYVQGEDIYIALLNVGDENITFPVWPDLYIVDSMGQLVVETQWCIKPQVLVPIAPNETYHSGWDQRFRICDYYGNPVPPTGEQVPPGLYLISAGMDFAQYGNESMPIWDSVWIEIGPAEQGPVADAGPDQTAYEGDIVQFNGSGSYGYRQSFDLAEPLRVPRLDANNPKTISMSVNSKGHIFVAWTEWGEGPLSDIYFARSVDEGASFEPEVRIGGGVRWDKPTARIAVDSRDNVYVAWALKWGADDFDSAILIARSLDGGETFEGPIFVNESISAFRTPPDVTIGENDTVYVTWQELPDALPINEPHLCVAKSDDGKNFSECVKIGVPIVDSWHLGSSSITRIVADEDGVYVGWECDWWTEYQRESLYVSRSTDGGLTFSEPVLVQLGARIGSFPKLLSPAMLLNQEGHLLLAWVDIVDSVPDCSHHCDVSIFRSEDGGQAFESVYRINDNSSGNPIRGVAMAVGPEGELYVAWSRNREGRIFVDRSVDGGRTFGEDMEFLKDRENEHNFLGGIAFTDDGTFHVTWNSKNETLDTTTVFHSQGEGKQTAGNLTYEWDFDASADADGNGNFTDDIDGIGSMPTWVYGDDGNFGVTLKVTDELGNWDTDTMNVTVLNVPPAATVNYTCTEGGLGDILLRIAGEKWHDVSFIIYEDNNEIYNETVMRIPGSPNKQMIGLYDFELNASRSYSAVARYTPEDDRVNGQPNGATPAWIIMRSGGKEIARLHHTFNVKHPDTWIWRVDDLNSYFPERECVFTAYISDLGSDDLNLTWNWGDGTTTERVYYNDGAGPDPYPSPDVNPIAVTDTARHSYASAGTYTITLTVRDDDGGVVTQTLVLDLS